MTFKGSDDVRKLRGSRFIVTCVLFALSVSANASISDRRASGRGPRQGLSLEERIEAEQQLAELGYWTGPVDGILDPDSRQALIAFQKVEGRERKGRWTREELEALRLGTRPLPLESDRAHIEVDLGRQVLFVVDADGSITHILPVCTGNEKVYVDQGKQHIAHTPRGRFKVVRKIAGWRRSTLGLLYYPNYIRGGIAIHGNPAVPVYPASHGCIRIPMFASKELSEMTPIGTEVLVYEDILLGV